MVDDLVVFPAKTKKLRKNVIYIMKKDGSDLRRLTNTNAISKAENDPKISPDKSKVALCRNTKGNEHHTIIVDIKTGKEKDISPPNVIEGIPEWSSDGKLLVFWQLGMLARIREVKALPKGALLPPLITDLFTVRPDGSQRTKVPLPKGLAYTMPAFFPGTGSGKNEKIVFCVRSFDTKP
jgi:dipeptidyl aminopeptidase/acylaminoacyl peptidase